MKTLALVLAFAVALGLGFKLARGAQEDVVFDGDYVYDTHCANCHGEGGMGVTLFGPPLRGDAFVTQGDNQAIAKVIQMGRKYRDKLYPDYMGMPRFQFIRAREMDDLITHLKGDLQTGSMTPEPVGR